MSEGWRPTVRPPRLGGKIRRGVFATRTTHRPNPLGSSVVKLEKKELCRDKGVILHLSGVDILDQTPVIDVKPYLPYSDSVSDAKEKFLNTPEQLFAVRFQSIPLSFCRNYQQEEGRNLYQLITEVLQNDPRPAYLRKKQGVMNEVFSFVDATHLISKAQLWKERDKAIKAKYEKLNNEVLPKVAHDKQARIGCKGKDKYWYGYKQHVSADMQSGLINKVAITPANVTDAKGMKHVCPDQGAVYGDKGYCVAPAVRTARAKGCHLAAVKKNNMKGKDPDKDHWYTKIRAPYERVFSQRNRRVRYKGIVKNQFAAFMSAICFNLKRLIVLDLPDLHLT